MMRPLLSATAPTRLFLLWLTAATLQLHDNNNNGVCWALRHSFTTTNDRRTVIGPVGVPFGFAASGHYELTVFDFELTSSSSSSSKDAVDLSGLTPGFYLHAFSNDAAYTKYLNTLTQSNVSSGNNACAFEYFVDRDEDGSILNDDTLAFEEVGDISSAEHGILLQMRPAQTKWKPNTPSIDYTFAADGHEAGLYFLTYQICSTTAKEEAAALKHVQSSFSLDFHFLNVDASGQATYLTAGELHLPFLFFFFAMSYLICNIVWIMNLRDIEKGGSGLFETAPNRPVVYPIHKLMAALLSLKFCTTLFESIRYHAIRLTGHAEVWSVLYYGLNCVRGIFLFTVILLIGTGWSFVKPFLNAHEKRIIFGILLLQVVDNIAIAVLSHLTAGERSFDRWNAVLHLVDIICCCAVLLPIVWQVNALEKSLPNKQQQQQPEGKQAAAPDVRLDEHDLADEGQVDGDEQEHDDFHQDREKGQILSKLKLFRSFYLLVVAYIYLTRIIVYLFATLLDYQHLWIRYAIIELVTLAFYVICGILFRPMVENPYLSVNRNEDDGSGGGGIAMGTTRSNNKK